MEEELEEFIDERINKNYYKIREDEKWKNKMKELNDMRENLCKQLSKEQQKQLEELIDIHYSLTNYESCFAYKLAVIDTIKFIKL